MIKNQKNQHQWHNNRVARGAKGYWPMSIQQSTYLKYKEEMSIILLENY